MLKFKKIFYCFVLLHTTCFFEASSFKDKIIKVTGPKSVRDFWTAEEDRILTETVSWANANNLQEKKSYWICISEEFQKRSPKKRTPLQCNHRWYNFLNPNLNLSPLTEEEKKLIIFHAKAGVATSHIALLLGNRSYLKINNFKYSKEGQRRLRLSQSSVQASGGGDRKRIRKKKKSRVVVATVIYRSQEDQCNAALDLHNALSNEIESEAAQPKNLSHKSIERPRSPTTFDLAIPYSDKVDLVEQVITRETGVIWDSLLQESESGRKERELSMSLEKFESDID